MTDMIDRTVQDFGAQWIRYPDNDGFYASLDLLRDVFGPLLDIQVLEGKRVVEIGSGAGRIVGMLIDAGAAHVTAVEPSDAIDILKRNTAQWADRIDYVHATGEQIPVNGDFDYIISIGVLHHIVDPAPVVAAAFGALRPGGRMLVWIYGYEGNEAYLRVIQPLRRVTIRLPDFVLAAFCHVLNVMLGGYILLCRFLPLPLREYMRNVIGRFSWRKRFLVIFDQLNPAVARYYRESEARTLLEDAGFADVQLHHRHGYSWTVIGTKTAE